MQNLKREFEGERGDSLTLWVKKVIWVERESEFCKCRQLVMACLPQRVLSPPLFFCAVTGEGPQCERRGAESEMFLMEREGLDEGERCVMV